jgi:hypothetical protein
LQIERLDDTKNLFKYDSYNNSVLKKYQQFIMPGSDSANSDDISSETKNTNRVAGKSMFGFRATSSNQFLGLLELAHHLKVSKTPRANKSNQVLVTT